MGFQPNMNALKKMFDKKTNHVRHIHLKGDMNDNKMERLNSKIRDRKKTLEA